MSKQLHALEDDLMDLVDEFGDDHGDDFKERFNGVIAKHMALGLSEKDVKSLLEMQELPFLN